MSFESPYLLIALVLVPAAVLGYWYLDRRRRARAASWAAPALLPNMVSSAPGLRRYVPLALFLLGLTFLLVGFARPQATVKRVREGATVVLAMDISGSMAANDVKPTRLAAADAAAASFITNLPAKYRASLVTFDSDVAVRVPPTYDRVTLLRALPTKAQPEGTALGDGLQTALLVATKAIGPVKKGVPRPPAAIVLFSDGTQNTGHVLYSTAAEQARKAGIPVSTVLVGTPGGVVVTPFKNGGGAQRQAVPTTPSALQGIAKTTGGLFLEVHSASDLKQVYKDLGSRLVKNKTKKEVTVIAVAIALGCILAGIALSGLWFRRIV
jgi:Ca-activated chloride channel family protein